MWAERAHLGQLKRWGVGIVAYLSASIAMLYPVLTSPVIADDLYNPFGQVSKGGTGLWSGLRFGWEGATEGSSFRLLGNVSGAAYNWLWLTVAARTGMSLTTFFAITKYVVLVAAAAAVAWCWREFASALGRRLPYVSAFVWSSVALFATLQCHAIWSNDPVANYPLPGYGAAALGFFTLGWCARSLSRPSWRNIAIAATVAVLATSYYEMNIMAVAAGLLLYVAAAVAAWPSGRRAVVLVCVRGGAIAALPLAHIAVGRFVTAGQADTYGGTTIRIGGAARTFFNGIVTTVPGSAWPLSFRNMPEGDYIVPGALLCLVIVVFVVRWGAAALRATDPIASEAQASPPRLLKWAMVGAIATYAALSLLLQAITVKVQDEAPGVGFVYTWYAVTSSAFALALAAGCRWLARRPRSPERMMLIGMSVVFVLLQLSINWQMTKAVSELLPANRTLLDAYDDDVPMEARCTALEDWELGGWPEYYRDGVVDGLTSSFQHYFGETFCASLPTPESP